MALRQHRETVVVPAVARDDRRPQRRAARDRRARDDRVRQPAAGERRARPDARRREAARARSGGALSDARRPLARGSSTSRARRIRARRRSCEAIDFAGLGFYPEELRFYPQGPVAAQVLGYAGLDNKGLEGLERSLEGTLAGQAREPDDRQGPVRPRARRRGDEARDPGTGVRLTIDQQIQANAEEVLQETVRRWGARAATAIVMDPHTGEVYAMATAPRFNANRFPTTRADRRRNRAVTDTYEPGSTFKLVTVAAGAPGGIVTPAHVVPSRADDQGRRPRHPRVAHAWNRAADRQADRRAVLEHRHDHDRAAPRRGPARVVDRPLRVRRADRRRFPRRVGRVRAAARPVVGLDDRHRSRSVTASR